MNDFTRSHTWIDHIGTLNEIQDRATANYLHIALYDPAIYHIAFSHPIAAAELSTDLVLAYRPIHSAFAIILAIACSFLYVRLACSAPSSAAYLASSSAPLIHVSEISWQPAER